MDTQGTQDLANYGIQQFRIERGAQVLGPDGTLGTVEQIVVDRDSGTLQSLVVRGEAGENFELPADRIERASGQEVHLSIGRADLASQPELVRPYTPEQYVPVDEGAVVPPSRVAKMEPDAPVLTEMESDAVEIATPTGPHDLATPPPVGSDAQPEAGDLDIEEQDTITLGAPVSRAPADDVPEVEESGLHKPGDGLTPETPIEGIASNEAVSDEVEFEMAELLLEPSPLSAMAQDEMAAIPTTPEQPLDPLDDMGLSDRVSILALAATGVAVGVAAGGLAYLALRRRRATPSGLAATRARLDDLRGTASAAWEATRAGAASRLPGFGTPTRRAGAPVQAWLPLVGLTLVAWRERGRDRLATSGSQWRRRAGQAAEAATAALSSGGAAREALVASTSQLSQRGRQLTQQVADTASRVQQQIQSQVPRRRARATTKATAAASLAGARAEKARRAAVQRTRRVGRRVVWFRRGMLAGAAWGLLYAPASGRESRDKIAGALRQVPGLSDLMQQGAMSSSTASGGTGPRPRTPDLTESATYSATGKRTPPPGLTSEEPLVPPPMPEALREDMPGATGL
jgi:hypothetical protein